MKLLIVDDDHLEVQRISEFFRKRIGAEVASMSTESEFISHIDKLAGMKLSVIIMDVMLRWADPSPDLRIEDIPQDVVEDGFYTAGIRCLKRLASRPDTKDLPVILYTTLDQNDFTAPVVHTKSDDLEPLLKEVQARASR